MYDFSANFRKLTMYQNGYSAGRYGQWTYVYPDATQEEINEFARGFADGKGSKNVGGVKEMGIGIADDLFKRGLLPHQVLSNLQYAAQKGEFAGLVRDTELIGYVIEVADNPENFGVSRVAAAKMTYQTAFQESLADLRQQLTELRDATQE